MHVSVFDILPLLFEAYKCICVAFRTLTPCKIMCVVVVLLCCNIVLGVLITGVCGADLMHTLWEADVAVFKAHITTGPGGKVLDMFWIYDNRSELPENHRCLRQGLGMQHMGARG